MSDEISFQTWICPKCFDDHRMDGPCVEQINKGLFMPHPEDCSYIAEKYRDRVKEIERLKKALEEIAKPQWILLKKDLDKIQEIAKEALKAYEESEK